MVRLIKEDNTMQSLDNLGKKKIPNYSLSLHSQREVKHLKVYYYQGGKWFNIKTGKEEKHHGK